MSGSLGSRGTFVLVSFAKRATRSLSVSGSGIGSVGSTMRSCEGGGEGRGGQESEVVGGGSGPQTYLGTTLAYVTQPFRIKVALFL